MMSAPPPDETTPLTDKEQTNVAIEWFYAMWDEAVKRGISEEKMAIVCLSAILNRVVQIYGEEGAAEIIKGIPDKIIAGNFSTAGGHQQQ